MTHDGIVLGRRDNVATALRNLAAGELARVGIGEVLLPVMMAETVEFGHKFALCDIPRGSKIVKSGEVVGWAIADIRRGTHAHVQNIAGTNPA